MSKKQSKNTKVKKADKKPKAKVSAKKNIKKAISSKNVLKKKASKPVSKKASKVAKPAKKNKKVVVRKPAKPIKKVAAKKKPIKPAKKTVKKVLKKTAKKVVKKVIAKKVEKVKTIKKPITKPIKENKVKAKQVSVAKETKPVVNKPIAAISKPSRAKSGRKPKNKGDDDEPEIIADDFIEEIIKITKVDKKPKQPKIIKTFVNPMAALQVAQTENEAKQKLPKKEPKGKFELEFVIRTSAPLLYEFISSPSGLSEWFADDVNIKDGVYTFFWDGSEQKAKLLAFKEDKFLRFQWLDKPVGTFVEFKIEKDELTGDVSLIITDFAEEGPDTESSKKLWDSQVNKLLHVLGSF
jgi:uncharacterized protein YndB with AHSA1/START domain